MNIMDIQNELIHKLKNIHKTYLDIFLDYINEKTRDNFIINEFNNQYYIFNYNNYKLVFNLYNNYWILLQNNTLLIESYSLNDIINHYLFITHKLSICLHKQSMDPDTEILNNIFTNLTI